MEALKTFNFRQCSPLRVFWIDDAAYFSARDVADALDYAWKGPSTIKHVPEVWRKLLQIESPGLSQNFPLLSEDGLIYFLNRSGKDMSCAFQIWLRTDVLPFLRAAMQPPAPEPKTPLQVLQDTIAAMVDQERKIELQDQRIQGLERRFDAIEDARRKSLRVLSEIPEPEEDAPNPSPRVLISRIVREYGKANGIEDFSPLWNRLYMEFRDLYHVDLKVIAQSRGVSVLDLSEEREYMDKLYALCVKLFKHRAVSPTGGISWSDTWLKSEVV